MGTTEVGNTLGGKSGKMGGMGMGVYTGMGRRQNRWIPIQSPFGIFIIIIVVQFGLIGICLSNVKSLCLVHTFLLTNGEKSAKFVNVSPIILVNCRFISEKNLQRFSEKEIGNLRHVLVVNGSKL